MVSEGKQSIDVMSADGMDRLPQLLASLAAVVIALGNRNKEKSGG
jgi:hypothetical protein